MTTSVLWLTVPVWWTLILSGALAQENCVYRYTEQPPASLGCSLESRNIQLKCKVTGPHNPHDPRLGIKWFRNSKLLQNNATFILTSRSEGNNITSTLTVQEWERNRGSYYCQLSISGSTSQTIPSVSLDLGRENNPGSECQSNTFFQTEPTCASVPMTRLPSPSVTATPMLLITSTTQTLVTSHLSLYTSPLPTPSPTVTTADVTPLSTSSATSRPPTPPTSATDSSADTGPSGTTTPLQVWLYVVVAVAAVFAMIIIILVIMCVGLCLRKSKTGDLETPKPQEHPELHFTAKGTSGVSNGLDQKHPDIQRSFTATTQLTNHSQSITVPETSNYNTLGERDYEVVAVVQNHEYHHLQRPTLQRSRAATYGPFSSSNTSIKDMRTMTSAVSTSTQDTSREMMRRDPATLASPPGSDRHHPYRNIDERTQNEPVYDPIVVRKPAVKSSQFPERGDSTTAHLLPNHHTRSRASHKTSDTLESDVHESLYNPTIGLPGNAPIFHHALANIPETGTMFPEPLCPSAFPVREYDCIPTTTSHYETPVSSKEGQSNLTAASLMSTMSSDYTKMSSDNLNGIMATGFVSSTMSSDYPKSSTDFTGSDAADFTGESTPDCTAASTIDFTVGSAAGRSMTCDSNSSLNGMINHGEMTSARTFRSLPEFPNVKSFANGHNKSYTANPMPGVTSDIVDHSTCTETSDFSGPILFPHMRERNHQYKKLDPSTMEPVLQYTKLNVSQRKDIV